MGYSTVGLQVSGSVSRHNSERDKQDDALWEELHDRIVALCSDPRYEQVSPMVF